MDALRINDVSRLMGEEHAPCVSVYLSTHPSGAQAEQDPVRLKNLLTSAEQQLVDAGMRTSEARDLLQPARALPAEGAWWNERSLGLALFISPGGFRRYRLPRSFQESVVVDRRFQIKPLLPLLAGDGRFFLLTLSQNRVRLFSVSRHAIEAVDVAELPTSMTDALNYAGADRGSQVHSAMRGSLGKQAAVFHGQGGQPDTHKDDLAQFFRMVDAAIEPVVREAAEPLLLAGVDYLLPIYRAICSHKNIAERELVGNCDYLTPHQLHKQAWPLMEPTFAKGRVAAKAKYHQMAGTGKTSDNLSQIVPAADQGRLDVLFVDVQAHQWGTYSPRTAKVELHDTPESGDRELLDFAVAAALTNRGTVYAVPREQVPGGGPVAAVYRY